ncbi:sporulation protein [Xylanibacillus composti]|uniref:putative sporulation protein YtxC n=1 Tax=Xylanibacillus composti TaxID=1572762 RepID=UPI001BCE08E2|nr:putative sporulation protein YtxC [Xylanibacillus composti]MDT9724708.1 sporulation protein [Xylanibacillus composti]
MHLFTISLKLDPQQHTDPFYAQLSQRMQSIAQLGKHIAIKREYASSDRECWTCEVSGEAFALTEDGPAVYAQASEVLAAYVLRYEELHLIRSIIQHDFDYYEEQEVEQIIQYCYQIMDEPEELLDVSGSASQRVKWHGKIAEAFHQYLTEHTMLNMEGFVRFRLKFYWTELREIVEYAIDEYMMDKQYHEFITLLKYFVCVQEAKVPAVHLVHKGEYEFQLFDEDGKPMEPSAVESFVIETVDQDVNFEDMIVSTLITVSPRMIYLHTKEPGMQVIKTIRQIFEDRVVLCTYCPVCRSLLHGGTSSTLRHP